MPFSGVMVAPVPTGESVGQIQLLENEVAHPPTMKKTSDAGISALLKLNLQKNQKKISLLKLDFT